MKEVGPHIVFAGGGTGGHLYPMLAVAHAIRQRATQARLTFLTTERSIDARVIPSTLVGEGSPIEIITQRVLPLPSSPLTAPRFLLRWRSSVRLCKRRFKRHRPDVVVGSGGYGSGPAICVARGMGIPTAILNPDAIPGKANRYLGARADAIFVQWPVTRRHFQNRESVHVVGCPVRPAFSHASREAGLKSYELDQHKRTLLITGASQGARSINEAIIAVLDRLGGVDGWQFLHLTGTQDCDRVAKAYQRRSLPAKVLTYTEHMADALAAADLVVSRAGASTLAELTAVGVGSVLMPYPHHRDKHQLANAGVLADAGAAVVVEDRVQVEQNASVLAGILEQLMGDGAVLSEMADKAAALGTCQAASTVADHVLAMGAGGVGGGKAQPQADSTDPEQGREPRSYGDSDLPTDIKVGTM